jgi:hypothetical protein
MDASDKNAKSTPARLEEITRQLQELEVLVRSGDCAPRVLSEFRIAVDNIRQTTWAVQQWTDLQQQHRDPYTVLDVLSKERVRRATQIAKDLTVDLESLRAVEELHERLALIFRKADSSSRPLI